MYSLWSKSLSSLVYFSVAHNNLYHELILQVYRLTKACSNRTGAIDPTFDFMQIHHADGQTYQHYTFKRASNRRLLHVLPCNMNTEYRSTAHKLTMKRELCGHWIIQY